MVGTGPILSARFERTPFLPIRNESWINICKGWFEKILRIERGQASLSLGTLNLLIRQQRRHRLHV